MFRTLAGPAHIEGLGLFTAAPGRVQINPSADQGIVFVLADAPGRPSIPASADRVVVENRRTVLSADPMVKGAPSVQTVEHLLSALAGLGVTNARVEVSGPEIPILDGSALPFVEAILRSGVVDAGPLRLGPVVVNQRIELTDPRTGANIVAEPAAGGGLELIYRLEYPPGSPIPAQSASLRLPAGGACAEYAQAVAPARTFSTLQDAQMARQMGLFTHLSAKDMLVIGPDGPVDNAYRMTSEPARHKLLDLLGDLSLCGLFSRGIHARITATRTGHAQNHEMARRLGALATQAG